MEEKLDDAAFINRLTGATRNVAVHVLWDLSRDGVEGEEEIARRIAVEMKQRELRMGSISPTLFLSGSEKGSLSSFEKKTVNRYIRQTVFGGHIAKKYGCGLLTLWFPDGSLYPGQVDLKRAYGNLRNALKEAQKKMDPSVLILIEYKLFEPGTYSTVIADWGSAFSIARAAGSNAGVLIDLGHHPFAVNIEQIVARLIMEGMHCGFHFNTHYAADDDHAVEPNVQMARIFFELVDGGVILNKNNSKNWALMIDQCSGRENRMHALLHSVDSLQSSLAKAILVDSNALRSLQEADEIILANRFFNSALIHADVRPVLYCARMEENLPVDPVTAYAESGYQKQIENERK